MHGERSALWDGGRRKKAKFKSAYNGKTLYFCAKGCKEAFEANPHKYMKICVRNPMKIGDKGKL